MIDTHAHLDFPQFDQDREEAIERAFSGGVKKIINIGCNLERALASIKLAEKYDNVYAAVGIHPSDVSYFCHPEERMERSGMSDEGSLQISETRKQGNKETSVQKQRVKEIRDLARHPKVVAIGEIGLDYFHMDSDYRNINEIPEEEIEQLKNRQKEFFIAQLELAREMDLPMIIHCRSSSKDSGDAYEDILLSLRAAARNSVIRGVIHCFSGNREHAKQFLDLGFYISFTGNITYSRGRKFSAPTLQDVVRDIPLERILIETDCPFLAPAPMRGNRNEPLFVKYAAEKIAEIKKVDFKEVERITDINAEELFGI